LMQVLQWQWHRSFADFNKAALDPTRRGFVVCVDRWTIPRRKIRRGRLTGDSQWECK
jgi:hypothetical protein